MTAARSVEHAEHFESLERQAHAARLGMWVFLATEVLLFGAAFALFLTYQVQFSHAFRAGVAHNTKVLGSVNTAVLLLSSTLVACAVHALRRGDAKLAARLVGGTIALGLTFLVIKGIEYGKHFDEGIYPGGVGHYFTLHPIRGLAAFWTLYFGMTALHALHVTIGAGVLGVLLHAIVRGRLGRETAYRLEVGAIYWHLVDVIWIFLWPLFYLA
ncbi:MAG: cytochrome c oxidase subunit 3 [Labilithrix sp.]|nr:cytochrome c oxidase subunit 3 [Labilithrix sp.]MBX3223233.1 cytochrome c oxidase subunit 3 [Labilithrix sp.]